MSDKQQILELKRLAYEMRRNLLTLGESYTGSMHFGGTLSMTDALIALFHYGMKLDPENPDWDERDRFVLSKGHGGVGLYLAMASRGYFSFEDIVSQYGKLDSPFGMHPCKLSLPVVETSSGSLGQGLPIAVGMAEAARQKKQSHRVFCMVGDGESCEGSIWEAALAAHSLSLGNLVVFADRNRQLMTSYSEQFVKLDNYPEKWAAFGWNVIEIDGNDMEAIVNAIDSLPPSDSQEPTVVVLNTIKGKGISFMEKQIGWHVNTLDRAHMEQGLQELEKAWRKELAQ